jgi:hypothetical protein
MKDRWYQLITQPGETGWAYGAFLDRERLDRRAGRRILTEESGDG